MGSMDQVGESGCGVCLAGTLWKRPRSFSAYWHLISISLQQIYHQIYKRETNRNQQKPTPWSHKRITEKKNGNKVPLPQHLLKKWECFSPKCFLKSSVKCQQSSKLKISQWSRALPLVEKPFWLNKCTSIKTNKKNILGKLITVLILGHISRKEIKNVSHS